MRFTDTVVPDEWASETLAWAEFHSGQPAQTAPLTWAQQVMWRAATLSRSHHLFMNLRRVLPVSPRVPADLASVARAVGTLVSRHSALRTRVRPDGEEQRQESSPSGRVPLLVVDADPGTDADGTATAQEVVTRLGAVAFEHADEWPQRFGLVRVGDRIRQIAIVFSHSTVDAYAVDVVLRDLRLILLRGAVATPPGAQSIDIGLRQAGPDRKRSARALDYWVRQFGRLPGVELPRTGQEQEPRWQRGTLVSPVIERAAPLVAARYGVSTSTVLAGGVVALSAGRNGRDVAGLSNMAHNRFRPGDADAVANLGQASLCVLELADRPTFAELLLRLWQVSLDGYRHSSYEPKMLRERFTELGYDPTDGFQAHYYFNDVRLVGTAEPVRSAVPERELRAVMADSTFSWTDGLDRAAWHLLTHVVDQPGAVGITLSVDTQVQPVESVEPFLRTLEELLVTVTGRDIPWPWQP